MQEDVVVLTPEHEHAGEDCTLCSDSLRQGDQIVICPRCKHPHHLDCWIQNGGCATRGCRQVARRDLLPSRPEEEIRVHRTPPWVLWFAGIVIASLIVGIYVNSRKAAVVRAHTTSVMVPATQSEPLWQGIIAGYNTAHPDLRQPIELLFTPYGPIRSGPNPGPGTYYEEKLFVLIAAKDAPEVVVLTPKRLQEYAEQEVLLPLDDVRRSLSGEGFRFDADRLAAGTHNGRLYGIPEPGYDAYFAMPGVSSNPDVGKDLLPYLVKELNRKKKSP